MDVNIWFWVWLALAVILSIAEIFTAGFFMLPFGIGAAVAALLEFFWPGSINWQWAAFIGISALLLVVLRRLAEKLTHDSPQGVAGNRLIGKCGTVIETLMPNSPVGRVRVEREEWRADAPGHEPIAEGTAVEVLSVVGTHLVVKPSPSCEPEITPEA